MAGNEHRYRVLVLESPAKEGRSEFSRPLDDAALEALTSVFDAARQRNFTADGEAADAAGRKTADQVLRRLGEELYRNLFSGETGDPWQRTLGRLDRPEKPLRLMLQMDLGDGDTARLHALPWECLRPPGELPLLRRPEFSLVRYLSMTGAPVMPQRTRRLRVLAVSADVCGNGLSPLDLRRELEDLDASGVDLEVEENPSLDDLDEALHRHRPHVLHFLGHGDHDSEGGGVLYLPGEDGAVRKLSAEELAGRLAFSDSLVLVFLNACLTARASHLAPFAGVATALARKARIPAVIAMQRPISDAAAARFAAEVYRQLAAGSSVDRAVSEGRRRLPGTEWATPVLFSRLDDGDLFAPRAPRPVARWLGWAAAFLLAASLAWFGLSPPGSGTDRGETPLVTEQGVVGGDEEPEPPGAGDGTTGEDTTVQKKEAAEPSEGRSQLAKDGEPPPQQQPAPETTQPPLYHLEDGGSVYLPEVGRYLSAEFNPRGDFMYPTLNLSGSNARRAVERPRTVEFHTDDGLIEVEVVTIDLEGRRLTFFPVAGGGGG